MLAAGGEDDEERNAVRQQEWKTMVQQVQQVTEVNATGMAKLREGDAGEALEILQEAEELLGDDFEAVNVREEVRAVLAKAHADTASNLGICHKRMGSRVLAVKSLQKAVHLYRIAGVELRTQIASHLNLSASLLECGSADQALQHAQAAVELGGRLVAGEKLREILPDAETPDPNRQLKPRPNDYAMLAVAYHKVAEASEGLNDWQAACFAYSQAYEVVKRSLGPDHKLTRSFEKSSRCPRRAVTPEVPTSWKAGKPTPRRLPDVPRSVGGRPRATPCALSKEYQLGSDTFPAWPPPSSTEEEQIWYSAADRHLSKRKVKVLSSIGAPLPQAGTGPFAQKPGRSALRGRTPRSPAPEAPLSHRLEASQRLFA